MFNTIDLFAGAGGLSLGFMQTKKFDIKVAYEFNPAMQETYKKNHLKRLDEGKCSLPAGLAFVDLLNTLEKIADNTYAIAQLIADENL